MNWIILIFAGLCEVGFAYCLGRSKAVSGYEWWTWIAAFAALYVLSAVLLAKATQTLPIGTAYLYGRASEPLVPYSLEFSCSANQPRSGECSF